MDNFFWLVGVTVIYTLGALATFVIVPAAILWITDRFLVQLGIWNEWFLWMWYRKGRKSKKLSLEKTKELMVKYAWGEKNGR